MYILSRLTHAPSMHTYTLSEISNQPQHIGNAMTTWGEHADTTHTERGHRLEPGSPEVSGTTVLSPPILDNQLAKGGTYTVHTYIHAKKKAPIL